MKLAKVELHDLRFSDMKRVYFLLMFLITLLPLEGWSKSTPPLADSLHTYLAKYSSNQEKLNAFSRLYLEIGDNIPQKKSYLAFFESHYRGLENSSSSYSQFFLAEQYFLNKELESAVYLYSFIINKNRYPHLTSHTYLQLGRAYLHQAFNTVFKPELHFQKAYEYLFLSLSERQAQGNTDIPNKHLVLISKALIEMQAYDLANKYLLTALQLEADRNLIENQFYYTLLLGRSKRLSQKHLEAIDHFNNAITLSKGDQHKIADALLEKSKVFIALEQYDSTLQTAFQALKIREKSNDFNKLKDISKIIYQAYSEKGQFELALEFQKLYNLYHERFLKRIDKDIAFANLIQFIEPSLYNSAQNIEEETTLSQAIAFQQTIQNTLIICIGFIVIFLIPFMFDLNTISSDANKLNEKVILIDEKNKEIQAQKDAIEYQANYLAELNESKDKLFHNLSITLKNSIQSFEHILSDLILKNTTQTVLNKEVTKIKRQTANISQDLTNLLQLSYTKFNPEDFSSEVVSLNHIIEEILNEIRHLLNLNKLNYKVNLPPNLQGVMNSLQLKEALKYLITIEIIQAKENDLLLIGYCGNQPKYHKIVIKNKALNHSSKCANHSLGRNKNNQFQSSIPKATICQEVLRQNNGDLTLISNEHTHKWYVLIPRYSELSVDILPKVAFTPNNSPILTQ